MFVVQILRLVKENKMKVKAKDTGIKYVTAGKEYCVIAQRNKDTDDRLQYFIKDDQGVTKWFHHSHFTVIEEQKPEITVGSEWVWVEAKETTTVKYAGDEKVFYKWNTDGSEGCEDIDSFLAHFKPKPKTVTMYFYKLGTQLCSCEVKPASTPVLFTKEIEL